MDAGATLERFAYTPNGTFGSLILPSGNTLYTVERPWRNNEPRISCIPEGVYPCQPRKYYRGGYEAIEVVDVPDRSYILIHKGNTMDDLAGCIAPGVNLGYVNNLWAVTNSREAFAQVMDELGGKHFYLEVCTKFK
jgi:hypothetical protein